MADDESTSAGPTPRVFVSYGRKDASELAERIRNDLQEEGYEVWRDEEDLRSPDFMVRIGREIEASDVMVALMSPHSVRNFEAEASVCLDEIAKARFDQPAKPIVPVMAVECQRPFTIFRLLYVDLTGWKDSAVYESGLSRLKQMIQEALSGEPPDQMFESPLATKLEPLDFGAFHQPLRERFHGRRWLFDEIDRWCTEEDDDRVLLITGDPGSGKSSIVAELIYNNPGGQVVAYHCCQHDNAVTRRPGKFVKSIATMLASQIPEYSTAIERGNPLEFLHNADADPQSAFEHGILNPLVGIKPPPGPARYILIDALDEALVGPNETDSSTILDLIRKRTEQFPKWLRLVATTRHDRDVLDRFKGINTSSINSQDPRNLRDIEEYVAKRLEEPRLAQLLQEEKLAPADFISRLSRLSNGSFLYAEQVLKSLLRGQLSPARISELPPGLSNLYDEFFERTFPDDDSYAPSKAILTVLLAANSGLTKRQLMSILDVSDIDLERALAPLSGYLAEDGGVWRVFHKSLADWLTDPEKALLRFVVRRTDGQERILEYCKRWPELEDDYPLRELPAHLAAVGDVESLLSILTDSGFLSRRRQKGVRDHVLIEDYRLLALLLLKCNRTAELAQLAVTVDASRRDGVAVALREASTDLDDAVRSVVSNLCSAGTGRKGRGEVTPEQTNGRLVAMRNASERGYGDLLALLALDPSVTVRAMLVPHLFKFWKQRPDEGWKLLDDLAPHFTKRLGMPREELVETIGGLAMAIVSEFFDDQATMARLGEYLASLVGQAIASPVRRAVGKGLLLKVGISALTKVIKDQPEYQPMNLTELTQSFPRPPLATSKALEVLEVLEHPEREVDEVVKAMTNDELGFDLILMSIAERALIVKGAHDPESTMSAIEQIYDRGYSWFHQSALYSTSKILETCDLETAKPSWLDMYSQLMAHFVKTSGATLTTAVRTYSMSSTLAGIEVVFERHKPGGRARFLPGYFEMALAEEDVDLAVRIVKAAHLVSLLGHPKIALDALDSMADAVADNPALEGPVVEVLANIRLFEDVAVDSRLADRYQPNLARLVYATSPTVLANEFPTMIDFFVNHQLINSADGRREICKAYRRALEAKSSSELLYDVIVWVTGLLTGTDVRD